MHENLRVIFEKHKCPGPAGQVRSHSDDRSEEKALWRHTAKNAGVAPVISRTPFAATESSATSWKSLLPLTRTRDVSGRKNRSKVRRTGAPRSSGVRGPAISRTICEPVRTRARRPYDFPAPRALVVASKRGQIDASSSSRLRTIPMRDWLAGSGRRKPGSASMKPGFASNFEISARTYSLSSAPARPASLRRVSRPSTIETTSSKS